MDPGADATGRRTGRAYRLSWAVLQLALVVALFIVYSRGRHLDPLGDPIERAIATGDAIGRFERWTHTDFERPLSQWLLANATLKHIALVLYGVVQWIFTPLVLAWIALRRRSAFPWVRNLFFIAAALGVAAFVLLPTSPPRLTPGFGFADPWRGLDITQQARDFAPNYAAMPSMHCAFASALALTFWRISGRRIVRWWWIGYAGLVMLIVFATSNHWWLDAVGGLLVTFVAAKSADGLGRLVKGWRCPPRSSRASRRAPIPVEPPVDPTLA